MTPASRNVRAVTLSFAQVELILTNMGLEDIDVHAFWRQALRELRNPGCLARERDAAFERFERSL